MRTARSPMTLIGGSLAPPAFRAPGTRTQEPAATDLAGTFTLPFEGQSRGMSLPLANPTLHYGDLRGGGIRVVELGGNANGSPRQFIQIQSYYPIPTTNDLLHATRPREARR